MKVFRAFLFLTGIILLILIIAPSKLEIPSEVRAQGIGTLTPESFLPYIAKRPDLAPTLTPSNTPDPSNPTPTNTPIPPTPTSTKTSTSTNTPTPTNTQTPTQTQTPTTTSTPTITPTPTTNPGTNYALEFDGSNDYVELDETALMLASTWQDTKTVSLWVRPANDMVPCNVADVAHCDAIFGDRPRWWGISQGILNNDDRIWVWNYDSSYDLIGVEYTADEWVHIAMVHDGGIMIVYRNGVPAGSIASGSTIQPPVGSPVLHIGGIINNVSSNFTFAGQIDEVRLWNIARDQADIIQDLHIPLLGTETGLAAYYTMDDASGLTLTDNSTNSWDGTLNDGGQGVPPDGSPPQWVLSTAFDTPTSLLTRIWRLYLAQ